MLIIATRRPHKRSSDFGDFYLPEASGFDGLIEAFSWRYQWW